MDHSSDYPIGIINIIKNGEKSLGLSIDETRTVLLSFRVNTELAAITGTDFEHGDYQKDVFRLLPSLHFQHFEVFAGPTFNYGISYRF